MMEKARSPAAAGNRAARTTTGADGGGWSIGMEAPLAPAAGGFAPHGPHRRAVGGRAVLRDDVEAVAGIEGGVAVGGRLQEGRRAARVQLVELGLEQARADAVALRL